MNLTKKQKRGLIFGVIILLFIITNPSISAFKAYQGSNTYQGLSRPVNLFVFSVYDDNIGRDYIGLFGNFIAVPEENSGAADSVKKKDPFAEFGGHETK
jgi:hypothetical protein